MSDQLSLDLPQWSGEFGGDVVVGENFRVFGKRVNIGHGTRIGDNVILVGDVINIGENVFIGSGSDVRSSEIIIGKNSEIGKNVRVLAADCFAVGKAARIEARTDISCRHFSAGNLLYIGHDTVVGYGGTMSSTAYLNIGSRVTIGQHSIINCNMPIDIGNDVGTGSYLALWTHGYHFGHGPLNGFEPAYRPVKIEQNVWLGFRVAILPGVTVGRNSIVAAGSTVTQSVPEDVLVGGAPAKIKKHLNLTAVSGDAARDKINKILGIWEQEFLWKGGTILASTYTDDSTEIVAQFANRPAVRITYGRCGIGSVLDSEFSRDIHIRSEVEPHSDGLKGKTILELHAGRILGTSCEISEDIRNHFRRHAMPVGDDTCFTSIVPQSFKRLMEIEMGQK